MDLFNFSMEQFQSFLLVAMRVGAILMTAPIFGSRNLPVQLKPGQSEFASAMQFFSLLFHFSAILTKIIQNDRFNIMYNIELNFNDLLKSHSKNL